MVSHDRSFMDRLVDHLFVFEGDGKITDFWGTYSERKNQQDHKKEEKKPDSALENPKMGKSASQPLSKKLSYQEERELAQLIKALEELEEEKTQINLIFENKDLPYDEIALLSEHL